MPAINVSLYDLSFYRKCIILFPDFGYLDKPIAKEAASLDLPFLPSNLKALFLSDRQSGSDLAYGDLFRLDFLPSHSFCSRVVSLCHCGDADRGPIETDNK